MSQNRIDEIRQRFANNKGGYVHYSRDDQRSIAYLALINPDTNTITGKMVVDLEYHVENLSKWKTGKGVIIYAGSPNFRLGIASNFAEENNTTALAQDFSYFITKVLMSLSKLPLISVCILSGVNEGLGAEISLYCDYALMENNAALVFNHAYLGITPGLLGATKLSERIGKKACMDLLLTCPVLSATAAKRMNIVDDIIGGPGIVNQAREWLSKKILDKSAIIVQSIKRICSCSNTNIGTYGSVFERNSFALLWSCHIEPGALHALMPMSSDESDKEPENDTGEEIDVVIVDTADEANGEIDTENNN